MQQAHRARKEILESKGLKGILERLEQKAQQVLKDRPVQLLQSVLMGIGIWVLLILGNLPEVQQARKDLRDRKEILGHKGLKEILELLAQKGRLDRKGRKGLRVRRVTPERPVQEVLLDRQERLLPSVLMGIGI